MKRLHIAAVFAVGLLASAQGQAQAQFSGYGCGTPNGSTYGIGLGMSFSFSCNKGNGGCLPNNQGYCPYYPCPTPWGGLSNYNPYSFYPTFGSYPFGSYPFGGHDGVGGHNGGGYTLLPPA